MKTNWMRSIASWGGWGAVVVAAATAGRAMADVSITLRASAVVSAAGDDAKSGGRAVTIADIAMIDPPTTEEATKIAEIVVVPATAASQGGAGTITIAQVRAAMDAAKVHWGRTTLRGSSCTVTVSGASAPSVRAATITTTPPPRLGLGQTTPQIAEIGENGPETIRHAVSARLVDLYNVDPTDLRLAFDAADEEFLAQTIFKEGVDRRVDAQPCGTGGSVRTPVSIAIYEGDRIAATKMVAVQALINRTVVTARSPIARGQVIGSDVVEVGHQWMAPNAKPSVAPDAAIGQIAARAIAAGTVLTITDVTAPLVCKRGDIVWVHALSGPLTVKAKCRAQGQARDGEMVQLKMDGSDRMFSARMSGPGKAVMITDDGPSNDTISTNETVKRRARRGN